MAGITLAQAEAKLTYWLGIEEQLGMNASVTIGDKTFHRHDLKSISEMITIWNNRVQSLSSAAGGTSRIAYGVPR